MLIRHGVTRTVFITQRYAIKVPSLRGHRGSGLQGRLYGFAQGILANDAERKWHDYEGWSGRVAPVLRSWLGGLVQVYPRCDPLSNIVDGEYIGAEPLPTLDPDPGDHKLDNYGVLHGRIVRLDYAMH